MPTENGALAILETPYRTYEGRNAPAQTAFAVDPNGILRDLAGRLSRLADGLEALPESFSSGAVATLRRGAACYHPLIA